MLSELLYFTNCLVNLVKCMHLKPYINTQTCYLGLVLQIFYCTFTIVQLMEHFLTWLHIGLLSMVLFEAH